MVLGLNTIMAIKKATAKAKGKQFEREIAELLTQISGIRYRRTPMSGALRIDFPGDVMKMEQKPSVFDGILLEMKNHKSLKVPAWIEECKSEMEDASQSSFLLVMKIKGEKYFLMNERLFTKTFKKIKRNVNN